jgi:phosphatidylglycerophosphatase A
VRGIFGTIFWGLIPDRWVIGFARLGPVGTWGKAPGTNGSVAGVLLYMAFFYPAPMWFQLLFAALLIYLAIAICGEAEVRLRKRDPGEVILDEFVAQPLVFIGWPTAVSGPWAFAVLLAGFVLFRIFDIWKPFGIRKLQALPGGQGVVVDDLAAAAAAWLVLHAGIWFFLIR